jgi:hypothetical protein
LLEGIEVDHHHVDGLDTVGRHDLIVDAAPSQYAAVYFRVQGFHPAIHHLGKAGVGGNFRDLHAVLLQQAKGATG